MDRSIAGIQSKKLSLELVEAMLGSPSRQDALTKVGNVFRDLREDTEPSLEAVRRALNILRGRAQQLNLSLNRNQMRDVFSKVMDKVGVLSHSSDSSKMGRSTKILTLVDQELGRSSLLLTIVSVSAVALGVCAYGGWGSKISSIMPDFTLEEPIRAFHEKVNEVVCLKKTLEWIPVSWIPVSWMPAFLAKQCLVKQGISTAAAIFEHPYSLAQVSSRSALSKTSPWMMFAPRTNPFSVVTEIGANTTLWSGLASSLSNVLEEEILMLGASESSMVEASINPTDKTSSILSTGSSGTIDSQNGGLITGIMKAFSAVVLPLGILGVLLRSAKNTRDKEAQESKEGTGQVAQTQEPKEETRELESSSSEGKEIKDIEKQIVAPEEEEIGVGERPLSRLVSDSDQSPATRPSSTVVERQTIVGKEEEKEGPREVQTPKSKTDSSREAVARQSREEANKEIIILLEVIRRLEEEGKAQERGDTAALAEQRWKECRSSSEEKVRQNTALVEQRNRIQQIAGLKKRIATIEREKRIAAPVTITKNSTVYDQQILSRSERLNKLKAKAKDSFEILDPFLQELAKESAVPTVGGALAVLPSTEEASSSNS